MDWRGISPMMTAGMSIYSELKNLCVWAKDNGGMGSLYRSRHELIFVWKHGKARHANNVLLGKFGRNRTNVWEYPGVNTFRSGREDELAIHPTVKPTALVADAIRDCSNRNDVILDAFSGSGTTIIAAAKTGRRGYALELDPHYVDVAVKRWEAWSGEAAHHATGLTFAQLQEQRLSNRDVGFAHVPVPITDATSDVTRTGVEPERPPQSARVRQRTRAA
jgi:DNA modification methylase